MRRRLAEVAVGLGLMSVAILVLPGLALVFAYVALVLGSLAFLRAGLRPASLSARSIATAVFLTGAMVWPLAKPMDVDTPKDETGTHGTVLRVLRAIQKAESSYQQVNGYFDSLECLLQTPCIAGIPSPPRYLSADVMRQVDITGYRFQFRSGQPATGRRPADPVSPSGTMTYAMVATPSAAAARSGATHAYCSDDGGRIYMATDGRLPLVEGGRCVDRSHPIQ